MKLTVFEMATIVHDTHVYTLLSVCATQSLAP